MNKNAIATRIQSRLNRKSIKVTLGEIKDALTKIAIDADNPTDDEINSVVQYFINQSSGLAILEQGKQEVESIKIDEPVQTKSEIIEYQSQQMGLILTTSDITEIADNMETLSSDLSDSLDEIRNAIIAFVKHKSLLNSQKISQIIDEVKNTVADEFQSNSQQLASGLGSVGNQINQQNSDFKSQLKAAISAFKLPAAT